MTFGVAIIGCGLIGNKRAMALAGQRLVVCADPDTARAQRLASSHPGAAVTADWHEAVRHPDVGIVIVATTNDVLAEIGLEAIKRGKHVLIEKPAARNSAELLPLVVAGERAGVKARVGFNHRFHPAISKAISLAKKGGVGELMFMRGRYGHGGRVGYDREWRADPVRSGGGELLDQGVHLIDLARCVMGDFERIAGFAHTFYWDMPVEDNGFLLLRTRDEKTAFLHASCTEWKNMFSMEIYGRTGKLQVDGLGGSYGVERLTHYKMLPEMGPPETTCWEYPRGDQSWELEFLMLLEDIRLGREPEAGLRDAIEVLKIVEAVYRESRK